MHFIFIDIQLLEPLFARFSTHYSWYISFISKISTKANRIAFFAYTFIDIWSLFSMCRCLSMAFKPSSLEQGVYITDIFV